VGHVSDLILALGGASILSEFPELNGVEQNIVDRCVSKEVAEKFLSIQRAYEERAKAVGSGFDMNPSPGNIKDGLITDAIKSAGAAKKGGKAPVSAILDYTEPLTESGLNLLCTPGNDVESTTGLAGSGANVILFTTGLGTPTGNPITPVIKISSNTELFDRMNDLIDLDAGGIIRGEVTIEQVGEAFLEKIIAVASGEQTKAMKLEQNDFIPWKRGVSL
jgi:altronate hydrolase